MPTGVESFKISERGYGELRQAGSYTATAYVSRSPGSYSRLGVKLRQAVPEALGHPGGLQVITTTGSSPARKFHCPVEALPERLDKLLALVGLVHARCEGGRSVFIEPHYGAGSGFRPMKDGHEVPGVHNHKAILSHATRKVNPHERQRVLGGLEDRDKGAVGNLDEADKLPRVLALRRDALYQAGKCKCLRCSDVLIEALAYREAQPHVAMDHFRHAGLVRGAGENNSP